VHGENIINNPKFLINQSELIKINSLTDKINSLPRFSDMKS
jgi:hypothetical protein